MPASKSSVDIGSTEEIKKITRDSTPSRNNRSCVKPSNKKDGDRLWEEASAFVIRQIIQYGERLPPKAIDSVLNNQTKKSVIDSGQKP